MNNPQTTSSRLFNEDGTLVNKYWSILFPIVDRTIERLQEVATQYNIERYEVPRLFYIASLRLHSDSRTYFFKLEWEKDALAIGQVALDLINACIEHEDSGLTYNDSWVLTQVVVESIAEAGKSMRLRP